MPGLRAERQASMASFQQLEATLARGSLSDEGPGRKHRGAIGQGGGGGGGERADSPTEEKCPAGALKSQDNHRMVLEYIRPKATWK